MVKISPNLLTVRSRWICIPLVHNILLRNKSEINRGLHSSRQDLLRLINKGTELMRLGHNVVKEHGTSAFIVNLKTVNSA